MTPPSRPRPSSLTAILAVALLGSQAFAIEWLGTANSFFSNAVNWNEAAPIPGQANPRIGDLKILNEKLNPLRYTQSDGHTIIGSPSATSGQFVVGANDRDGRLEITGGTLHIYSYWSPIIAQVGRGTTGAIHVNGGVLRIANSARSKPIERFFRVGNTSSSASGQQANGAIFIGGGLVIIECEGGEETQTGAAGFLAGGLNIGRGNGNGLVYLTGGKLTVTSPHGTSFSPDNGLGNGVLTFGLGDGVFEQTGSSRLTFGTNPDSECYITFQSGSAGALSLAGATRETFEEHVRNGHIRIEGGVAEMTRFAFTREGSQGVLRLASARSR